ncbi:hypothetical protein HETIRDRAFT_378867 [Heterobasidion irregulare TC 32-1]|uniref:Uncharacterized protein n=1 Tax=Heterobasidion irregulare (strain TC 32-1) TaxID=747525 RepID=W4KQM6_HETIT|nr:uncharacterized protein HETIRDRAFT_378867 [Heterobasidion irregulare TC 32-1]ETW87705.1 hypothetical protein HETIRDRAFT_378867 [Heterobasidion irregulare TC 32-1]
MARATRSAKQQDDKSKGKPSDVPIPAPTRAKAVSKKRKRTSIAENDERPAVKLPRNGDAAVKEEDHDEDHNAEQKSTETQGAGDIPMDSVDAQHILDILEMVDTQGLLDRVFPLPADPADSTSLSGPQSHQQQSYSFRTLLKESSRHPLRVLRSGVQHLLPVFAHPRSRPSAPAAQQLKFCNLALSLLDQASFNSCPAALNLESILPDRPDALHDSDHEGSKGIAPSLSSANLPRKRKYALMQKLPTGKWWTSLNSDFPSNMDGKELKDLSTAHAELVAILPSASTSAVPVSLTPTLGSYTQQLSKTKQAVPGPRQVSTGAFLDYGPYSSFAPAFDQEGVEVGRVGLGEVLWSREKDRRTEEALAERARLKPTNVPLVIADVEMQDTTDEVQDSTAERQAEASDEALQSLFTLEQVASIKGALGSLEMEEAVQELLDRNSRALRRLEELQLRRLGGAEESSSSVEVGSEEWDVAQSIMDSLTLITSLRPCSSKDSSTLIPPPSILRKLHRTLPTSPSEGWYGTLPSTQTTALRDDSTLLVKSGTSIPTPAPAVAAPPVVPAVPTPYTAPSTSYAAKPNTPATPYGGYSYPTYANGQYRGGYSYTPATTNAYYPNAYAQSATGATSSQYVNPQYAGAGQTQYPYGSWFSYQPPTQQKPGTPQPTAGLPTSYASFFNAAQPQRAVANTVAKPPYAPGAWQSAGASTGGYTPTLPTTIRTTPNAQPPGTPTPPGAGYQYYGGYQPQPAQAEQR